MSVRKTKNIVYKKYVKTYLKRQANLRRQGFEMEDKMLDKKQFRTTYKAWYNTRMQEIREGNRKTVGNLYGEIVSSQVSSDVTYKQAKNILQAMKKEFAKQGETGKEKTKGLSILKIRKMDMQENETTKEFWDIVKDQYYQFKNEGFMSVLEAKEELARMFFGSK